MQDKIIRMAILCVAYPIAFLAVLSNIVWPDHRDDNDLVPMDELLLRALVGAYMLAFVFIGIPTLLSLIL